ncbi:hypothetical protein [Rhodospirillum centenum]|uniref:Uncharacterized protein n=1 Tax=Rhodospirillum centenum (strain ATCC 51521 / SW) TaxID=414684 RepID=B6IR49_RHOCS|nr:hypothetical protein [Rhodospirillum centenum]ACI97935.1 conserved hypothetical protein [Rhodospirillum centenum SW]
MAMGERTGSTPQGGSQETTDRTRSGQTAAGKGSAGNGSDTKGGATAGGMAHELSERARETGERLTETARAKVRGQYERQQTFAADQISGIATALRQTERQLRDQDQGFPARYVGMAAEQVEDLAEQVSRYGFEDLLSRTETFARRQPEMFIGGAMLAGVALGRFLRASGERRRARISGQGTPYAGASYGSGGGWSGSSGQRGAGGRAYTPDRDDDVGSYGASGGMDERTRPLRTRSSRADEYAHYPAADGLRGRNVESPVGATAPMHAGAGGQGAAPGGTGPGGLGDTGSSRAGTPGGSGTGTGAGPGGAGGGLGTGLGSAGTTPSGTMTSGSGAAAGGTSGKAASGTAGKRESAQDGASSQKPATSQGSSKP